MHVSEMMNTQLATAAPQTLFPELLARQAGMSTRQLYVVDEAGRLSGVITSFDVLRRLVPQYLDPNLAHVIAEGEELIRKRYAESERLTAQELMIREVVTLKPGDTLIEANVLMTAKSLNALPVVDAQGRLVGEITRKRLLRHIAQNVCGLRAGSE